MDISGREEGVSRRFPYCASPSPPRSETQSSAHAVPWVWNALPAPRLFGQV